MDGKSTFVQEDMNRVQIFGAKGGYGYMRFSPDV